MYSELIDKKAFLNSYYLLVIKLTMMVTAKAKTTIYICSLCNGLWTTNFTFFTCWVRREIAFSVSTTVLVSPVTDIATAAAISEGLNSKKSIPAFNSHPPKPKTSDAFNQISLSLLLLCRCHRNIIMNGTST